MIPELKNPSKNEQSLSVHGQWAQYYGQLGLRVVPNVPRQKKPAISEWPQEATVDLNKIAEWWTDVPEANIGVATGHLSGIVDIETDMHKEGENGEQSFQKWCENNCCELPKTWTFKSGSGGIHRLFQLDRPLDSNIGILPGVDVIADNLQAIFPPSVHPNGNCYEWIPDCAPSDMSQGPAQLPLKLFDFISIHAKREKYTPLTLPDTIPEGQRDTTIFKFACKLRQTGLAGHELIAAMEAINKERCTPPMTSKEIGIKCRQAERYPMGETLARIQNDAGPLDWNHLEHIQRSDLDDARRFAEFARGSLLYTDTRGGLKYSNGVWVASKNAAAFTFGVFADSEHDFAMRACIEAKEDEEKQAIAKECLKHAWKIRKKSSIDAITSLSVPYLTVPDEVFDANAEELNTQGGVVNLRTGIIRSASPEDYCTQSASVSPVHTQEGTEMWNDHLQKMSQGNAEFIKFLQFAAGMIAVGKVYQENCLFAVGSGRNGKSTFFNALFRVLGSYATSIDPEVLLANKQNREVLLAGLRGKRFALASETEEGVRLSSSALKRLTSTDPIAAKQLYKDPMTFTPTHTLVLYTNHLPKVGSTDGGTLNRIKVVPFTTKWFDNDTGTILNYCDVLVTRAGGDILSWVIEGARQYLAAGCKLPEPLVMQAATAEYKTSEDWLQNFIGDCCIVAPEKRIKAKELYDRYRYWGKTNGEYIRSRNDFFAAIKEHGYEFIAPQNIKTCVGITIGVQSGLGFV